MGENKNKGKPLEKLNFACKMFQNYLTIGGYKNHKKWINLKTLHAATTLFRGITVWHIKDFVATPAQKLKDE